MADILAAFDELEKEERKRNPKKGPKPTNTKYRNPLLSNNSSSSQRQGRSRPRSLPPLNNSKSRPQGSSPADALLSPSHTSNNNGHSDRSPSVASGRRISFVDSLPRPPSTQHRLRIPTKGASLASGFTYDGKLNKYGVIEQEWKDFCDGVIERANLPRGASWAWTFHKKDTIKKIKRDMQYEGSDMKRYFNAWNRNFRRRGFTVSIEVPGPAKMRESDTEEEKERLRKEAKLFRMVVTPLAEKAGSIYSRTSSLTRGVSNEGLSLQPSKTPIEDEADGNADDEDKAQAEDSEIKKTTEPTVVTAETEETREHKEPEKD